MSGWRIARPDVSAIGARKPCAWELPAINPQEHGIETFTAVQALVRSVGAGESYPEKLPQAILKDFPLQCSCGKIDTLGSVVCHRACVSCAQQADVAALEAALVAENLVGFGAGFRLLLGRYGQMYGRVERKRWLAYEAMAREVVSGV